MRADAQQRPGHILNCREQGVGDERVPLDDRRQPEAAGSERSCQRPQIVARLLLQRCVDRGVDCGVVGEGKIEARSQVERGRDHSDQLQFSAEQGRQEHGVLEHALRERRAVQRHHDALDDR